MNRNEIIKTANDVGINKFLNTDSHIIGNFLESFAKKIAEVEREACLKVFESYETFGEDYDSYYADKYADLIRARWQE
jgi:hypothetical protein